MNPSELARELLDGQAPRDPNVDVHVFWACLSILIAWGGLEIGQKIEREGWKYCRPVLEDGRLLKAETWGVRGAERCLYESPRPMKRRRG
jgi:hypothetical protein